jgi:hypothetical protein
MPIPLILLLGGGAMAAASRAASWLAERHVRQVNQQVAAAEASAAAKNAQYRDARLQQRTAFEARLGTAADVYREILRWGNLDDETVAASLPETWVLERIGELRMSRPLLIQPQFDRPLEMEQMKGYRAFQAGTNIARDNPAVGGAMQGVGMAYTAGAYISQQTKFVGDADKYIANAKLFITSLNQTIALFDTRYRDESTDDNRSVQRLETLLAELQQPSLDFLATAYVQRTLITFLQSLITKYA